jgi:hypothetical protein
MGHRRHRALRPLRFILSVIAAILIILDEVARPVFQPISRAFGRLRLVTAFEGLIGALPAYGVLACLLVPFAIVEPLKVIALFWIGEGRMVLGIAMLVGAYLASFLVVDRIYHAGRERLLSIGWFAAIMERLAAIRDAVIEPIRRSPIVQSAIRAIAASKLRIKTMLSRRASSRSRLR